MIARRKKTSLILTGLSSTSSVSTTSSSSSSPTSSSLASSPSSTPPISPSESSLIISSSPKVHSSSSSNRFIGQFCLLLLILVSLSTQFSVYFNNTNDITQPQPQHPLSQSQSRPSTTTTTTNDQLIVGGETSTMVNNSNNNHIQKQPLRATATITTSTTTTTTASSNHPKEVVITTINNNVPVEEPPSTTTTTTTKDSTDVVTTSNNMETPNQEENNQAVVVVVDTTTRKEMEQDDDKSASFNDTTTVSSPVVEKEETIHNNNNNNDILPVDIDAIVVVDSSESPTDTTNSTTSTITNAPTPTNVIVVSSNHDVDDVDNHPDEDRSASTTSTTIHHRKWHVTIAHEPRYDLLGSFVLPTILLYGVAHYYNWTLQILPFAGTSQHEILTDLFAQKGNLSKDWGSGFQDANTRPDYNPMELNEKSYETMGFFPEVIQDLSIRDKHPWIQRVDIPVPGTQLNDVCEEGYRVNNSTENDDECYILLSDHPGEINNYINVNGGLDLFFTPTVRQHIRDQFLSKNHHRLLQYETPHDDTIDDENNATTTNEFNVAVHIRRGDILHPYRWIDQQVFANVAQYICTTNTAEDGNVRTNIHVFSAGPNRDGNWSIMERLSEPNGDEPPICANVYFHFDEIEFDSWTYFVAADALIISPSTFSYVPALIRHDNVFFPNNFWHLTLSSFIIFDHTNGNILMNNNAMEESSNVATDSTIETTPIELDVTSAVDFNVTNTDETHPSVTVMSARDGDDENESQWHVTIAHEPRYDLLGSFVLPTMLLYGVTRHQNWTLVILPFAGSQQHAILTELFAMKGNLDKGWGSGFQDASHRADYDPMELNDKSYDTIGFFPEVTKDLNIRDKYPWIRRNEIPLTGKELNEVCKAGNNNTGSSTDKECYILLSEDPYEITKFINMNGGIDVFFTSDFGQHTRTQFLLKNHDRLQRYEIANQTSLSDTDESTIDKYFNVAIHIRRGDILHPDRWIDQQVFANVAKHICQTNNDKNESIQTNIHVFSSGPNRDGNWSIMESLAEATDEGNGPVCANVYLHLDEVEFDSWTFMVAADALVISTSTFSYVPALIRYENVYYPRSFWHPALSSFIVFDNKDGTIVSKT